MWMQDGEEGLLQTRISALNHLQVEGVNGSLRVALSPEVSRHWQMGQGQEAAPDHR